MNEFDAYFDCVAVGVRAVRAITEKPGPACGILSLGEAQPVTK